MKKLTPGLLAAGLVVTALVGPARAESIDPGTATCDDAVAYLMSDAADVHGLNLFYHDYLLGNPVDTGHTAFVVTMRLAVRACQQHPEARMTWEMALAVGRAAYALER